MEFEANSYTYRTTKIDTFKQLYVVRRMAPMVKDVFTSEIVALFKAKDGKRDPVMLFGAFTSFAEAAGKVSDDDMTYIIDVALHSCQRRQGDNIWVPVMQDGILRFQDISAPGMLLIAYNVLSESLGNFFAELRSMLGMAEKTGQK